MVLLIWSTGAVLPRLLSGERKHELEYTEVVMKIGSTSLIIGFTLAGLVGAAAPVDAQILKKLKKTVERAAERETLREVDRKVTSAVRCAFDDLKCIETAEQEGKAVEVVDPQGNVVSTNGAPSAKPGEGAWANYDFVPGERVLFATEFSEDNIGDFPRRLEFAEGSAEIVEWQGRRMLRLNDKARFQVPLPETLPERFTIEFDLHNPNRHVALHVAPNASDKKPTDYKYPYHHFVLSTEALENGVSPGRGIDLPTATTANRDYMERLVPVRIMADGPHVKMYLGETRVANLPKATFNLGRAIDFIYGGVYKGPAYIGNIRIAAGGADLYDALAKDGRVATQGIFFATGSDRIQPQSTPTLKEITQMLQQHGDLRLTIEGHTDNTGDDAANQQLSEKRAAAVKQYLVQQGIDASRLQAKGLGESRPAASNDTTEGRQQNRRVELVKQ